MEEDWLNLLNQVESDPELSHTNVLEKIKEVLKADRILYEDWHKNDFHVDHLLKVGRKINDHVAGKDTVNSQSVLQMFTKFGMVKTVKLLVKYGADVSKTNSFGSTPLLLAAISGNFEIVEELVNNAGKLTINNVNVHGKTALLHAIELGFMEIANALIDNGAKLDLDTAKRLIELKNDVNATNSVSKTPLHYPIKSGNIDVLKYLIEEKGGDGSVDDNLIGGSLVRYAAECGQLAVFKNLVEDMNFDYETPDEFGKSAIHYAAAAPKDSLDIVKYLIENKGVNHNVLANNMLSPMSCASMSSNLEVMKYLLEEKHVDVHFQDEEQGYTALYHVACAKNSCNLDAVKYLIEKGADFNVKTKKLRTPVRGAAYYGKLDVVKYLVEEMGADIHIQDVNGHNALSVAVERGNFETAKYFIEEHDMDVNKYIDHRTMLHLAVHSGNLDLVKYLIIEKGAKKYINYKRADNFWTPLHESTTKGYEDITELLLKEGATVNTPCMFGVFPIHQAAKRGYQKIAELLINYGSDLDVKEDNGLTPLHKAATEGDNRMVQLLVERGANIGIRNPFNATARDIALSHTRKYQAVVDYLKSSSEPNVSRRSRDFYSSIDFKSFAGRHRQN